MAKKKKKSSSPQMTQIPGVSQGDMTGMFTSSIAAGSKAATAGNIADRRADSAATVGDILLGGGANIVNPELVRSLAGVDKTFKSQIDKTTNAVNKIRGQITSIESRLLNPNLKPAQKAKLEADLKKQNDLLAAAQAQQTKVADNFRAARDSVTSGQPTLTDLMSERFPEARQAMERSQPFLDRMGQLGVAGERLMGALGQGFQANQITSRDALTAQMGPIANIAAQQIDAPRMGNFGSANALSAARVGNIGANTIGAGQVGAGQLGGQLMARAMRGVELAGRLGDEEIRDAVQSARQAFAARGLATGGAAIGAELLNRSRFQRQREFEDLALAGQVQESDMARQRMNMDRALEAERANQLAALQAAESNQRTATQLSLADQQAANQMELANLDARLRAAIQSGDWELASSTRNQMANLEADRANQATQFNLGQFNASEANRVGMFNSELGLRAQTANEEGRRLGNQANIGMLGDAYALQQGVNQEGLRAVGLGQSLASAANPYNQAMALYGASGSQTGTQAMGPAANLASNWMQGALATQAYNAAAQDYGTMLGRYGNYGGQSGGGTNWGGLIGGALAGGAALAIPGGAPFAPAAFALGSGIGGSIGR